MVIAQTANDIAIIPQPVSLEKKSARFVLSGQTKVAADAKNADVTAGCTVIYRQGKNRYRLYTGCRRPAAKANVISFALNKTADKTIGKEGYTLDVTATGCAGLLPTMPQGCFMAFKPCYSYYLKKLKALY